MPRLARLDLVVKAFGRLVRIRSTRKLPTKRYGDYCAYPPEIRIHADVRGREFFETLLHESLHHAGHNIDEDWIGTVAGDFAELMYRPEILRRCGLSRTAGK